ncbi:MAG: pyridoxal phosphate-dependent aminotransferase [Candidatus Thermoplasmatota archaeon]|nr:pyridoxal phosphate-dependent aminotransferase [Candidatus Thermoplasmatota archaeon]
MDNNSVRRISNRVLEIQGSAIHEMTRLSRGIDDVAFLSWAKPTSGTPEHIRSAAVKAIEDGRVGGYSSSAGIPELRRSISEKLRRENHIDSSEDEIVVTVGAIEGLAASVMAVIDPGDEVIFPIPTYSTHIRQVQLASGKPVFVPTDEEKGFDLDNDAIQKAITPKTKAIMYCSPNNPTGAVYGEEQLRGLADIAIKNDLFVITDEAYEYFTYDGFKHFSIASIPEMKERTLSSFTFTKTYAMTGWRIGYMHADAPLIPHFNKAHIPLAICAPVVSQYAALAALEGPQDCVDEFRKSYRSSRDLMCKRLDELDQVFDYQKPKGSYLMFPRIIKRDAGDSTKFCKALLKEAKVSTTPGIAFGPNGEGHARMSFCVPEAEVDKAFDRMEEYFN